MYTLCCLNSVNDYIFLDILTYNAGKTFLIIQVKLFFSVAMNRCQFMNRDLAIILIF